MLERAGNGRTVAPLRAAAGVRIAPVAAKSCANTCILYCDADEPADAWDGRPRPRCSTPCGGGCRNETRARLYWARIASRRDPSERPFGRQMGRYADEQPSLPPPFTGSCAAAAPPQACPYARALHRRPQALEAACERLWLDGYGWPAGWAETEAVGVPPDLDIDPAVMVHLRARRTAGTPRRPGGLAQGSRPHPRRRTARRVAGRCAARGDGRPPARGHGHGLGLLRGAFRNRPKTQHPASQRDSALRGRIERAETMSAFTDCPASALRPF
jgi:hypothetical protein